MTAGADFRYLGRPDQWEALARVLPAKHAVAVDTEYLIEDRHSPAFHSRIHVWSIGYAGTLPRNARGVIPAVAWVLPVEALANQAIAAYLTNPEHEKWAHNAGVDRHALGNHGVVLGGCRDSLSLYRWLLPERVAPGPGFALDSLGRDLLGPHRGKTEAFLDLVSRPRVVTKIRCTTTKTCSCGALGCRKRTGHTRTEVTTAHEEQLESGTERFPLSDIGPAHARWDRLIAYSARDVLIGSELVQYANNTLATRKAPNLPW